MWSWARVSRHIRGEFVRTSIGRPATVAAVMTGPLPLSTWWSWHALRSDIKGSVTRRIRSKVGGSLAGFMAKSNGVVSVNGTAKLCGECALGMLREDDRGRVAGDGGLGDVGREGGRELTGVGGAEGLS